MNLSVRKDRPYGTWTSPWSPDLISSAVVKLSQPMIDGNDIYWLEQRPSEAGRNVIVRRAEDGTVTDVTPDRYNVRTRVHEYGGGAYIVSGGQVYFSNFADNGIWSQAIASAPHKIFSSPDCRFADFALDRTRNRLIVIKEQHIDGEPVNSIDYVMLDGSAVSEPLVMGSDFFSSPRISPDGRLLCWMSWNHPNMPWDESTLWTANIGSDGLLANIQKVAGGRGESVLQPEWGEDGTLYFICDKNGWWNLFASYSGLVEPLIEMESEFGYPHWIFAWQTYALAGRHIWCAVNRKGVWSLACIDTQERSLRFIDAPFTDIGCLRSNRDQLVFLGGSPLDTQSVWVMDLGNESCTRLRASADLEIAPEYISKPEIIEFKTSDDDTAYAFFYAPSNPEFEPPPETKPPLIVKCHGGPTAAASTVLNPSIQYWTSRGFAVVDVNYRGSTGFGRNYREKLNSRWGIVDVDDCEHAARFLVERGWVDPDRLCISGGSAGGYTVLCALTFRRTFKAGASYYGVSDLEALAKDTHKFESRYEERLVGHYPEQRQKYFDRSPLNFAGNIACPVIFFQGLDDKVVPPSQSEAMVNALRKNGIPVVYITFQGEQHGFRKSDSIRRCLEAELQFYCAVFGINRDDFSHPLAIENFEKPAITGV